MSRVNHSELRSGRELILASRAYAKESQLKSWYYVLSTATLLIFTFGYSITTHYWFLQLLAGLLSGLLMVRFFILYHDFNHDAILRNSTFGKFIMIGFGLFILAPVTIWKRSHDYHHWNNSKLGNNGIGAYPLLTKVDFLHLSKPDQLKYLTIRHPLVILFGYFTLFIYNLNLRTFLLSPRKHWDSLLALTLHFTIGFSLLYFGGISTLLFCWLLPFLVSNGVGAYLFYVQHNFPGAKFFTSKDWEYTQAAIMSTSYLEMGPIMEWFTGNIGYHHIHHLNHQIPFYRLKEAMDNIVEMQNPVVITLSPKDVYACLQLKVWDQEKNQLIGLKDIYSD